MQFTFLDFANTVLFVRDDAERAQWSTEEMSLDLEFPYKTDKVISIGQRVFFIDPNGNHQIYEVKQAKTLQPDAYQQVTAEHICISELSDEHLDNKEITDKTCSSVLSTVLSGTQWAVGTKEVNPTSSVDISRGSVWQAVLQIKDNWNVYIEPRVTLSASGKITRYLDIKSTNGVWNGLRLSIDKNFLDPSVTYDDSNVATALYGYGGTIHDPSGKGEDKECDFANVVWSKTDAHPAKPKGKKYLEDPAATKEFGRNGRARFAFYQNNDITDPATLLQKTWETLQTVMTPDISIEGTVADLYRMGYADEQLALHEIALVEILPSGFKKQLQIIRYTVDLLDPSASPVTIGSYIPNIIYIQRETDMNATGGRGGGGGNKSKTTEKAEFEAQIQSINAGTGLRFTAFQRDMTKVQDDVKLQEASIKIEHDRIDQEVIDRRDKDNELSTSIQQNAKSISLVVKNGKVDRASIVLAINNGKSSTKITADEIELDGHTIANELEGLEIDVGLLTVDGTSNLHDVNLTTGTCTGDFDVEGDLYCGDGDLQVGSYHASWQSYRARFCTVSSTYGIQLSNGGTVSGALVTGYTDNTIYYLGR